MLKIILLLLMTISLATSNKKEDIINILEGYNNAFSNENYSKIISFFDYPTSFNLNDKTIMASNKFKLRLIYWKIRGGLPEYYSYSKWDEIKVKLIDDNIAIVNAKFSRYKNDDTIFYSGEAQYYLRYNKNEWKIFSLTPYEQIKDLN